MLFLSPHSFLQNLEIDGNWKKGHLVSEHFRTFLNQWIGQPDSNCGYGQLTCFLWKSFKWMTMIHCSIETYGARNSRNSETSGG